MIMLAMMMMVVVAMMMVMTGRMMMLAGLLFFIGAGDIIRRLGLEYLAKETTDFRKHVSLWLVFLTNRSYWSINTFWYFLWYFLSCFVFRRIDFLC